MSVNEVVSIEGGDRSFAQREILDLVIPRRVVVLSIQIMQPGYPWIFSLLKLLFVTVLLACCYVAIFRFCAVASE